MTYQKMLVDNTKCNRRFHLTWDDESAKQDHVKVECWHCGKTLIEKTDHPEIRLARDENLIKTTQMSPNRITTCDYTDKFSPASVEK